MNKQGIRDLALANGFKLKEQPNGELDLNPYVYDFANALIDKYTKDQSAWVSVDDRLPEGDYNHVLVACEGGYIGRSFYCTDKDFLRSSKSAGCYSRKAHGKNSGFFDLSHQSGYKITHWQPLPLPPTQEA